MIRSERAWPRIVAHADMDALSNSMIPRCVEEQCLWGPPSDRGVVLTASYEARPYGVGSAMPMARARRLCPGAVIVPPRFDRYRKFPGRSWVADFSPEVEPISLDEAFLVMTGSEQLFGNPEFIRRRLKDAIREATGA